MYLLRFRSWKSIRRHSDQQYRPILLTDSGGTFPARCRTRNISNCGECRYDRWRSNVADMVEIIFVANDNTTRTALRALLTGVETSPCRSSRLPEKSWRLGMRGLKR